MLSKYKLLQYPCGLKVGEKLKMIYTPESLEHKKKTIEETIEEEDFWTVLSGSEEEPDHIWLIDDYGNKSIWSEEALFEQFERA